MLVTSACAVDPGSDYASSDPEQEREAVEVAETLEALSQPVDSITLNVTADTSVRTSSANKNFGTNTTLDINRTLLRVDGTQLLNALPQGDYPLSAKLRLTLVPSATRRLQRNLEAHRVLKDWTETGATWNCAVDSNPSNNTADCSGATKWSMTGSDAFVSSATGTAVIPATRTGVIEIDVTKDVRDFKYQQNIIINYGWLLKTGIGNGGEVADIASRESGTPPQLVITRRKCNLQVCDDGLTCSQDGFCDTEGMCFHLIAAPVSPCSDNNACTVSDHCSGMNYDCIPGTPAATGTPCGSGLQCDGAGACVPTP